MLISSTIHLLVIFSYSADAYMYVQSHLYSVYFFSEQDICFHEKQLELDPTAVSTACLFCMQEPVGKLLSLS